MKTRSAKNKGKRLQNKVAYSLSESFPEFIFKSTTMGESGVDIQVYPRGFGYSFECKNQESLNIWKSLEQAEKNTKQDENTILVFSKNRSPIYAVIKFDKLLKLLDIERKTIKK